MLHSDIILNESDKNIIKYGNIDPERLQIK